MTPLFLAALLQVQPGLPPDSIEEIRRAARRAEARFERLSRQLAPRRWGSSAGTECDEIVGRFCLTYDSGRPPDPGVEPSDVVDARRDAIEALRFAFSFEAHRLETMGPLVRYLVEDDRAEEAVSAARTYAALSGDSVWGPLLLGFAQHAAANDTAAERLFDEGLSRLPLERRRRVENLEWILSPKDRDIYEDLEDDARRAAEELLWRHSDPLYMTPGNERRAEHIARRVWARVLSMTPRVMDMVRWGDDLEQLTVRYGVPTSKTRTWGTAYREGSTVEHYDPDQLAYVAADVLSRGPPPTPLPGESWELEEPRSRSGYAPKSIRRLIALDHQITRFPAGDSSILRLDAQLVLDSAATGRQDVLAGLWVLDAKTLDVLSEERSMAVAKADTVRFHLETPVAPGARLYSVEALERESGLAGRARYVIDVDSADRPAVSDPLLAMPFPADSPPPSHRAASGLHALTSLVVESTRQIGFYAEATGLAVDAAGERRYRVELSIRRADRAAFPARALSWIGRRLGLSGERAPPRVAWNGRSSENGPVVLAVNLGLEDLPEGLHAVAVTVTDQVSGGTTTSSKVLRIVDDEQP